MQIFEAEELFHKEQVPFTSRILTRFVNAIKEKTLNGKPSDCKPAIMDLVLETQTVLSGMPQPEWSRTQLDEAIQDIASSTKCPAELSRLTRSMQRAIRAHELHIKAYQAWMWVEQTESTRGTYEGRAVLTNAALQLTNLLQPFQNIEDMKAQQAKQIQKSSDSSEKRKNSRSQSSQGEENSDGQSRGPADKGSGPGDAPHSRKHPPEEGTLRA